MYAISILQNKYQISYMLLSSLAARIYLNPAVVNKAPVLSGVGLGLGIRVGARLTRVLTLGGC